MNTNSNKIAVVGMACRLPGAKNVDEYWNNLILGKETLTNFTDEELAQHEPDFENINKNKDYVKVAGILSDIDKFDAGFFGMTPRDAKITDPQQRIWLETVWEAFENAGCDPLNYRGSIGVFAGGAMSSYLISNILRDPLRMENFVRTDATDTGQIMIGNDISYLPTKTAYNFNLRGPAIFVQTACSTSLVAIAQACQSLYSYESDVCIAGGVRVSIPQEKGYIYQEGAIPSSDGHCRPFDAMATGTVGGNGVGAVVLKRLEDAIKDHDTIYALVSGWALNNDGSNKVSYTAPSIDGQAKVIRMAQSFAEVSPEEISYIEAHGTATQLGDPIEMAALTKAFTAKTDKKQFCGIGSVKSNIGHTDAAAGVASFIKTCLAAYHKKIPASLHYKTPNPHIDFENSPFYVQKELKDWTEQKPLIMGVSSFGIGGTNAHVIVEQAPVKEKSERPTPEWPELILLSAKSEYSLEKRKEDLVKFIKSNPDSDIRDVAYTLANGRSHMLHRSFLVATSLEDIASGKAKFTDAKKDNLVSKIAFAFPGQGAQYVNMGKDLYKKNETFRNILDECFKIVTSETGEDLGNILFENKDPDEADRRLAGTELTQPALFIIEYALTKVLEQLNIRPDYLIGHSIGEYTAACVAGVFDMQTALKIVIKRGQLMSKMPTGKMMAVQTGIDKLKSLAGTDFEIAADNAPEFCTISFKTENSDRVKALLDKNEIRYIPLNTSHAFHSAAFDPIVSEFSDYVNQFRLNPPELPFISCLTGMLITEEQAISGSYWARQLRNSVLFNKGIETIGRNKDIVFLEVGPNTHLSSLIRQNKEVLNKKIIISTLGKPDDTDERSKILNAIGNMYSVGINIDTDALRKNYSPNRIALPVYPFDRKRHWIDVKISRTDGSKDLSVVRNVTDTLQLDEDTSSDIAYNEGIKLDKNTAKLFKIWKSLIGSDEIGLDEDFLDLGGNSLLALQIITRIKEVFGISIPLNTFLDNSTITKLGAIINKETSGPEVSEEPVHITDLSNLPLSSEQKRLWTISQLDKNNPAYNITFAFHLIGDVNLELFNKSMNILFNRHHIMFSTFKQKDGVPYCEIVPKPVNVELIDYSEKETKKAIEEIYSFISDDSRKCFNLETGPLYRLFMFKQDDSNYYFYATIHHIIFDGWSNGVFIFDFNRIYKSLAHNEEVDIGELNFHIYDYAKWQESNANKLNEEKLSKFWINYLKDVPAALNFPYDYPRKDVPTGLGEKEFIKIPAEYSAGLKRISKNENSTLFVTLLSAFGALLNRYSGQNDICIGSPVGNRPQSRLENIFGMLVNTIVIRLDIDDKNPFKNLVQKTRNSVIEAISNQELPFEKIVEAVKPQRTYNTNPLFQVCFAWQNNLGFPLELEGVTTERITLETGISPFDLTFYMYENGEFIEGEIEYNVDILKRETIIRLKNNFLTLIRNLVEEPDVNIGSLPILDNEEVGEILGLRGIQTDYPSEKTIATLFEEMVSIHEDKKAVVFKGESLTYNKLNEKTNQLARTLRESGVRDNTPVAILAEKSLDMIVGILGILKAGGGYVPIDPEYPEHRIDFMIKDSGCKVLLVQDKSMGIPVEGVLKLNLDSAETYKKERSNLENINNSTDLAYIMYTSGTTGTPKGSMIMQKSVARLVRNTNYLNITPDDRILLTGAIVFDATTFEIWGALLNGGTLYIVEKETILNPKALGEELLKNEISILWLTSALFTQIAETHTKIFGRLKYLLTGGDVLSAPHINKVRRDNPDLKVINGYGPTENTTFSTTYLIEKDFDHNIPIGKSISNSTAYIFDKNMNYQPIGVLGELYVGGDGLSMGYLNREDLNKKSFVDHPYINGEKLYKTGDYARWLPDGNIEFHGRIDNQLKIRGFRVELGEIESVISEIDGIIETVIKPIKTDEGDVRLAAFLNVSDTFSMDAKELSRQIKEKLPPYMIPSAFKQMHGFPKTVNGKTDKDKLVLDVSEMVSHQKTDLKTFSATETKIYNIWSEALKTKEISPTDNFFDIGGSSLTAISVFSKIESAFDVDLGLRIFFDSPRIKDLAEAIEVSIHKKAENKSLKETKGEGAKIISGEI
jgi:amino acid adenylation domain-containing protein